MSSLLDRLAARLGAGMHGDRRVLDGLMAAAALVAIADGDASLEESQRIGTLLRDHPAFASFDSAAGTARYLDFVARLHHGEDGMRAATEAVREVATDHEVAALTVALCHAVSRADGVVLTSETQEIDRLCLLLGIEGARVLPLLLADDPGHDDRRTEEA